MQPTIFLFDLDGVLVRPGGYRAAVRATVNHLCAQLGLPALAPDDDTIAIFEAQGMTSEWDMVPVLLAIILNSAADGIPRPALETLADARGWLAARPVPFLPVVPLDFAPTLRRLGRYVVPGQAPAETILAACQEDGAADLFPNLVGQGVLRELFTHTRRLDRSPTTALFEMFAIGDAHYTKLTGLPPEVRSESLLARLDVPLLTEQTARRLTTLREAGWLRFAAYTARPSLPAERPGALLAAYAPEAELALARVGIEPFPLMGAGQMSASAARLGENEERLLKPAPYHALAAVAAAWTGDERAALAWMEAVFPWHTRPQGASRPGRGLLPDSAGVHVFEDSPGGLRGGTAAAELLRALGMDVRLSLWGVAEHPDKVAALRSVGARVFPDVNQAVAAALEVEES